MTIIVTIIVLLVGLGFLLHLFVINLPQVLVTLVGVPIGMALALIPITIVIVLIKVFIWIIKTINKIDKKHFRDED